MDHLDIVTGTVAAHPFAAGQTAADLGSDSLEDGFDIGPCFGSAARHDGGTQQSAFFTAGNTGADEVDALFSQSFGAADGVGEEAVSAVDEDITLVQVGDQLVDEGVHSGAGLDHHHDAAGGFQIVAQLLDGVAADEFFTGTATVDEVVNLFHGTVVNGTGEAVAFHIEDQVLAHNCETDQTDICFFHFFIP